MDHSKREHARLSASSAHRWLNCTPSALFEENFEGVASPFAVEGTYAHEYAEVALRKALKQEVPNISGVTKKAKAAGFDIDEMKTHAKEYADYVESKITDPKHSIIIVEQKVDFSKYVPDGFGTADCVIIQDGVLSVVDYKYGRGVEVSAENNPQMMLYALGAIEEFYFLFEFDTVEMCIFQPRLDAISEFSMNVYDLLRYAERYIKPRAKMASEGEGEYVPGDHCRFCKAKAKCRALMKFTEDTLMKDFDDISDEPLTEPAELTNTELANTLAAASIIRGWLDAVESYALGSILNGDEIPGYKAVESRTRRSYIDENAVIEALKNYGCKDDEIFRQSVKTITEMEKQLGKKKFQEVLGDLVQKPKGKPTIVPISDTRESYRLEDEFEVEKGE